MNPLQGSRLAEAADRRWHLMALAMLLLGLKSAISASMVFVEPPALRYLDWAEAGSALAAVGVILWLLVFKFTKVPADQRHEFLNMEGFVSETSRRALKTSWLVTFVTLSFLGPFTRRFSETPTEFFLQAVLALMLVAFSVSFFVLNARSDDDEGPAHE